MGIKVPLRIVTCVFSTPFLVKSPLAFLYEFTFQSHTPASTHCSIFPTNPPFVSPITDDTESFYHSLKFSSGKPSFEAFWGHKFPDMTSLKNTTYKKVMFWFWDTEMKQFYRPSHAVRNMGYGQPLEAMLMENPQWEKFIQGRFSKRVVYSFSQLHIPLVKQI